MYQENKHLIIDDDLTEQDLNELIQILKQTIIPTYDSINTDTSEWDLKKEYEITWACMWNKPGKIGSICKILQKNDKIAIVAFEGETILPEDLYRLEDLKPINI